MKSTRIIYIIVTIIHFSCNKQENQIKLVYPQSSGLPMPPPYDFNKDFAKTLTLKKWGFTFQNRGGCIPIDSITRDSLKLVDFEMYLFIEKKYGKDWIKNISNDAKTTHSHLSKVDVILDTLSFVVKKRKEFQSINQSLSFDYELNQNHNQIIARAFYSMMPKNISENGLHYSPFQITFDIRNYSIVVIDKKTIIISNNELDY